MKKSAHPLGFNYDTL